MRIRKNAKISQLSFSSTPSTSNSNPHLLKTHQYLQCQLNQSPWDIITFPQDPSSHHFQVDMVDCEFAGNGSYGESIGAIQSSGSMKMCMESEEMCSDDRKWADWEDRKTNVGFIKEEEDDDGKVAVEDEVVLCGETNSKGWQCGRVVKEYGHTTCARHLKKCKLVSVDKKSDGITPARRGRGRPRIKTKEPAKNPNEFYYYSGFGPPWGKKKGSGRRIDHYNVTGMEDDLGTGMNNNVAKSAIHENVGIDYMECEDDDVDDVEDEINGKRRGRKRIKARSLKSLM